VVSESQPRWNILGSGDEIVPKIYTLNMYNPLNVNATIYIYIYIYIHDGTHSIPSNRNFIDTVKKFIE